MLKIKTPVVLKKKKKNILLVLVGGGAILFFFVLWGTVFRRISISSSEKDLSTLSLLREDLSLPLSALELSEGPFRGILPENHLEQAILYGTRPTGDRWRLKVTQGDLLSQSSGRVFWGSGGIFFESVNPRLWIQSQEIRAPQGEDSLFFSKAVQVTFEDGFTLQTEEASLFLKAQRFFVSTDFLVTGQSRSTFSTSSFSFQSHGLECFLKTHQVHLLSQVQTLWETRSGSPPIKIRAPFATLNRLTRQARFFRPPSQPSQIVLLEDPPWTSRSQEVQVSYQAEPFRLRTLQGIGAVHLKDDKNLSATAEKAFFDLPQDRIILSGFPQVYEGPNTFTGEIFILYRQTSQIEIQEGNSLTYESPPPHFESPSTL